MTTRKRNEWLEADIEDEENAYESEEEEESRGAILTHSRKRIKTADDRTSDMDNDDDDDDDEGEDDDEDNVNYETSRAYLDDEASSKPQNQHKTSIQSSPDSPQNVKPSKAQKQLAKKRDTVSRSGVIYISHIPPFMKPHTLKKLLTPYASNGIGRIFLTPEDADRRQARVKAGGNKKRNFVDGWVEFVSKKEAKICVETLNTRTIGGKKGGFYFDDIWSMKYLKGFKWHHLTEQIATENAERESRMRVEGAAARREMRDFLSNVERSKIEATRRQKRMAKAGNVEEDVVIADPTGQPNSEGKRQRSQSKPISKDGDKSVDVVKVVSKIF
jgi:ESF2/ABP1 family protein